MYGYFTENGGRIDAHREFETVEEAINCLPGDSRWWAEVTSKENTFFNHLTHLTWIIREIRGGDASGTGNTKMTNDEVLAVVGDETEESLGFLARWSDISYDTLLKAARRGKLKARKSGRTWLSTRAAVEEYQKTLVLKPRKIKTS